MLEEFEDYYRTQSPGVYALYLDDYGVIDVFGSENAAKIRQKMTNRLLYIGETSNLHRRIENQHLKKARISTLRRTIASLLNMNFIPVSGKKCLTQEDEEIITDWLNKNTYFRILETSTEAEAIRIEAELIRHYQPPLNIKGINEGL